MYIFLYSFKLSPSTFAHQLATSQDKRDRPKKIQNPLVWTYVYIYVYIHIYIYIYIYVCVCVYMAYRL